MSDSGSGLHDVAALLASGDRDFLIRSNGEQVKISDLDLSIVGLYFSASWCGPCRNFTPKLIEAYNQLSSQGKMEIVFISADEDEGEFKSYFSKMPWLAIPFSDLKTRDHLNELFKVLGIPHLVILDAKAGTVISTKAVQCIREYGAASYPFTPEAISQLKEKEEVAKKNQTLQTVLASSNRNYLLSSKGEKVLVSELEGKYVGLFFTMSGYGTCNEFSSLLVKIYEKVKEKENFEVVTISLDDDEESFDEGLAARPWFAVPFKDQDREKLLRYFDLINLPTFIMLDTNGKTLSPNIAEIIEDHGVDAWEGFPYSPEKLAFLAEKAKAKMEQQTLESLLVTENLDYVVGKEGTKVPVKDLVGKTIGLYFSAQWCGPCRAFLPKLIEDYHKIRAKDDAFEIIFISSDSDQSTYDEFFSGMPWLALPFRDERGASLKKLFKIRGIPSLVAIGPTGRTISVEARDLLMMHGADAYPFTEERLKELEQKIDEMAKGWPEKVKHEFHEEHELVLTRMTSSYGCDGCDEMGHGWSYRCTECNFDLHPKCALEKAAEESEEPEGNGDEDMKEPAASGEGYVCEGDVCRRV